MNFALRSILVVATLLAGIFTLEPRRPVARFAPVLILVIFAVILLGKLMNFHRKLLSTLGMIAEQTSSGSKWKAYELEGQKIIYKEKLLVCVQIIRIVDLCS